MKATGSHICTIFTGGAILLSASFLMSCSRRPKEVLGEREMVSLMADMQLAEACANSSMNGKSGDLSRYEIGRSILSAHGVTQEQLDTTLAWYGRNLDDYSELFEKVDKEIESRRKSLIKGNSSGADDSETDNLWRYGSHSLLSANGDIDAWVLSLENPDILSGDILEWSMHLINPVQLSGVLGVEYEDGSGTSVTNMFVGRPKIEMRLQTDTGRTVRRIYGTLSLKDAAAVDIHADSILLRTLPFDSLEYRKYRGQKRYGVPCRVSRKLNKPNDESAPDTINTGPDIEAVRSGDTPSRPMKFRGR